MACDFDKEDELQHIVLVGQGKTSISAEHFPNSAVRCYESAAEQNKRIVFAEELQLSNVSVGKMILRKAQREIAKITYDMNIDDQDWRSREFKQSEEKNWYKTEYGDARDEGLLTSWFCTEGNMAWFSHHQPQCDCLKCQGVRNSGALDLGSIGSPVSLSEPSTQTHEHMAILDLVEMNHGVRASSILLPKLEELNTGDHIEIGRNDEGCRHVIVVDMIDSNLKLVGCISLGPTYGEIVLYTQICELKRTLWQTLVKMTNLKSQITESPSYDNEPQYKLMCYQTLTSNACVLFYCLLVYGLYLEQNYCREFAQGWIERFSRIVEVPFMERSYSLSMEICCQLSGLCIALSLIQNIKQFESHIMNVIVSHEVLKLQTIFSCLFDTAISIGLAKGLFLQDLFSRILAIKGYCNRTVKHQVCLMTETDRNFDGNANRAKLSLDWERKLEHANNNDELKEDNIQDIQDFVKIHKTTNFNLTTRPGKSFDAEIGNFITWRLPSWNEPEAIGLDEGCIQNSGLDCETFKEGPHDSADDLEPEERAFHELRVEENGARLCLDDPFITHKTQASGKNLSESIDENSQKDISVHVIPKLNSSYGLKEFNFCDLKKLTKKPGSARPDLTLYSDNFYRAMKSSLYLPEPQIDITVGILEASVAPHFEPLNDILKKIADGDSPSPHVTMRYELLRLCTLRNYPKLNKPYLIRLAGAGFYFAGVEDEVICYCCGVRRQGWVASDIPADVHKRLSSNCRFLRKNIEVNIPVPNIENFNREKFSILDSIPAVTSGMYPRPAAEDVANDASTRVPTELSRSGESGPADASKPITNPAVGQMPKHPQYAIKATRLASFNGWPDNVKQSPEVLADAGFYYAGFGDCVRCFFCGTGLRHWAEEDNAFIEHARWSRNCFYLKQKKGQEFINLVSLAVQYTQDDQQSSTSAGEALRRNEVEQVMLSDPAQSVLEMGYDSRIIKLAIERLLATVGRSGITSPVLMEKVLEIEDEESTASVTNGISDLQVSVNNETASKVSYTSGASKPSQGVASGNPATVTLVSSASSENLGTSSGAKGGPKDIGPSSLSSNGTEKKPKSSDKASNEKIDPKTLKAENEKMREQTLCKVCLDKTVCIVFLPCGHLVTCGECAPAMRKCPICRALVKGTVRTYMN